MDSITTPLLKLVSSAVTPSRIVKVVRSKDVLSARKDISIIRNPTAVSLVSNIVEMAILNQEMSISQIRT